MNCTALAFLVDYVAVSGPYVLPEKTAWMVDLLSEEDEILETTEFTDEDIARQEGARLALEHGVAFICQIEEEDPCY